MRNISFLYTVLILIVANQLCGQSAFSPSDPLMWHRIERIEIKNGKLSNEFHSNVKPFEREAVAKFTESIDTLTYLQLSKADKFNIGYLQNDNWEFVNKRIYDSSGSKKPLFKYLYKSKSDMYHHIAEEYDVHVSPVLHFGVGSNSAYDIYDKKSLMVNTRGIEIRGRINSKLGFYTMITDNIVSSPNYVAEYYKTYKNVPYQSFIKAKDEDYKQLQLDYFNAIGYFTFKPIKNLLVTFGHDTNFIGSGMRSMVLSDFSAPYLQLKTDLRIGRVQYLNIIGQMTNLQVPNPGGSSITFPPKYIAFHHLNLNVTKTLNIGLFESVMFANRDTGFELNYLNPLIFYRFIEGFLGSSDNALIGADFKLNAFKTFSLYGQYFLDEYNSKEFKKDGWWSKKYAWQLGLKYIDVLKINNLDAQIEFNRARPYMYSHFTTYTNYVNYNNPIAHPLGANFKEYILNVRYQPVPRLHLSFTQMVALKGQDDSLKNFGGNILLNNRFDRPSDYNNFIGQGVSNKINNWQAQAQFMIKHNLFIDVSYQQRTDNRQTSGKENIFMAGLRLNFQQKQMLF